MKDKYFNSDLVLKSSPILRSAALAGLIILAGAVGLQADSKRTAAARNARAIAVDGRFVRASGTIATIRP